MPTIRARSKRENTGLGRLDSTMRRSVELSHHHRVYRMIAQSQTLGLVGVRGTERA